MRDKLTPNRGVGSCNWVLRENLFSFLAIGSPQWRQIDANGGEELMEEAWAQTLMFVVFLGQFLPEFFVLQFQTGIGRSCLGSLNYVGWKARKRRLKQLITPRCRHRSFRLMRHFRHQRHRCRFHCHRQNYDPHHCNLRHLRHLLNWCFRCNFLRSREQSEKYQYRICNSDFAQHNYFSHHFYWTHFHH